MNKEVKELIEEIKFIRDTFADGVFINLLNKILNYITNTEQKVTQLETKINTYENPEDMTLMFMWCDEKAKDRIKQLEAENNQLETNRDEAVKELFILKDMIYKPETREENFEIQRKISSILIELERGKDEKGTIIK